MRETDPRRIHVIGSAGDLGQVIMYDDMEGVSKWGNLPGYGTIEFYKAGTYAYNGNAGLALRTVRSVTNGKAWAQGGRQIQRIENGVVRCEMLWRMVTPQGSGARRISRIVGPQLSFNILGEGLTIQVGVRFDCLDNKMLVQAFPYEWMEASDVCLAETYEVWHRCWFVYDVSKGRYVEAGVDGLRVDVSGFDPWVLPSVGSCETMVILGVGTLEIGIHMLHVDEVAVIMI